MSETKRCPQCQAEIPAAAPEGLCPQCLLQAALDPKTADAEVKTAAYTPTGSGFVPPTPAVLQAAFPQLEILELLGKGGMGAVYKARQRGLDRLVAVKILPPEVSQDPAFAERFTREARALALLNHPNIVGVYDSGHVGGYYYFVMEYVDGVNLRQAMRAGTLKAAEALKIVPQICEALQFAHDEGIVHRDIKPENILLDKKGRVKIADFGLAKLLGRAPHDVSLTGTQQVMGTMHYMAPEQIEGARDVDHRADIYSLGVTFYEMLTGELPIGRFAAPSKKVQIDVRLDEVVLHALEKEPELRYQHASEIKTEVETIARSPTAITKAASVVPVGLYRVSAASGYLRTVVLPFVALVAVLLVIAAVFMVLFKETEETYYALGNPKELAEIGAVLAIIGFLLLNAVWLYRTMPALRPASHGIGWSVVCLAIFVLCWTPTDTVCPRNQVCIDEQLWPHHGVTESKVSLEPPGTLYRRLILREELEADLRGHWEGEVRIQPAGRKQVLTKHTYTLELDPLKPTGDGRLHLIVDARNGMSWRVTNGSKGYHMSQPSGTLVDAGVVAEWLRLASTGPGILDDELIERQAQAIVGVLRRATSEQISGFLRPEQSHPPVVRLDSAVSVQMGTIPMDRPLPFRDWNAAVTTKWAPTLPILYVGVPLMLTVWVVGLWLLLHKKQVRQFNTEVEAVVVVPAAPHPAGGAPPNRPRMVPILGAINIFAGVMMLFMAASSFLDPEPVPANAALRPIYDVWVIVDPIVSYATSVLWFGAGIGLMLWKPWARRVTVAVAVFQLAFFVVEIPAMCAFSIMPGVAEAPAVGGPDPGMQAIYVIFLIVIFGGFILIGLAYLIAVLIYLSRPHVIAAFGPRDEQSAASI